MSSYDIHPVTGDVTMRDDGFHPSFKHQRQPTTKSCLPTSFAMVMDLDATAVVHKLTHGVDRDFHIQEMLVIGLEVGWAFSPHERYPKLEAMDGEAEVGLLPFNSLLQQYDGVLTGKALPQHNYHAVAWCHKTQKCLDPRGAVYSLDGFEPDCFWLATKIAR